jgi:hypothetical protein
VSEEIVAHAENNLNGKTKNTNSDIGSGGWTSIPS